MWFVREMSQSTNENLTRSTALSIRIWIFIVLGTWIIAHVKEDQSSRKWQLDELWKLRKSFLVVLHMNMREKKEKHAKSYFLENIFKTIP